MILVILLMATIVGLVAGFTARVLEIKAEVSTSTSCSLETKLKELKCQYIAGKLDLNEFERLIELQLMYPTSSVLVLRAYDKGLVTSI